MRDGFADRDHRVFEARAIFGELDRVDRRAEEFEPVPFDRAVIREFDREIESGLSTERGQQGVRPFARDDRFERGRR
jgi:hypothetical protein